MAKALKAAIILLLTLLGALTILAQEALNESLLNSSAPNQTEEGLPEPTPENATVDFFTSLTGLFADNIAGSLFTIGARLTYDNYVPLSAARIDIYRNDILTGSSYTDISGNVLLNSSFNEGNYLVNLSFPGRTDITSFGIFNFLPSFNFTLVNYTQEISIETDGLVQLNARIGEPVRWAKKVKAKGRAEVNVSFETPAEAENVVVTDLKEKSHILPRERRKSLSVGENRTFEFTDNVDFEKEYIIEFETPAPEKAEEFISSGQKRVRIFSGVSLHYVNVSVFTEVRETALSLKLFHIIDGRYVDVTEDEKYKVRLLDNDGNGLFDSIEWNVPHLSEQLFEIGVATINTDKPIYHPGETAVLTMVVLDRQGHLVSNADVFLNITNPLNLSEAFSTADTISPVSAGIYSARYPVLVEGNYTLTVRASGMNVDSFMVSHFEAMQDYPFDILRSMPHTTDPWKGPFEASIAVIPLNGQGAYTLTEVLPPSFNVTNNGGAEEIALNGRKLLTWSLEGPSSVSYSAIPPLITPEVWELRSFVSYGEIFDEARPYYLAVDPLGGIQFSSIEAADIAMCPLTNTSFALAWVESGIDPNDNLKLAIYNTDGTVNQSALTVFAHMNNLSRVDCSTINGSEFVLGWYVQSINDVNVSRYNNLLTRLRGPTVVDLAAGTNGDISLSTFSGNFTGVAWADSADGDYNYIRLNWFAWTLGAEVNFDNNIAPGSSLTNLLSVNAISGARTAHVWFDDAAASNPVTIDVSDGAGSSLIGQTAIGIVGETGRVSAASLREDRIATSYFNSTDYGIYIRVDDLTSDVLTNILQPTKIDANASDNNAFSSGYGISTGEIYVDGSSMFAVAWFDGSDGTVKAGVYGLDGAQVTAPFTVSSSDTLYRMVDIMGASGMNVSLCNGTFIVALSNSSNVAEFREFRADGSQWDGRCAPNNGPNITLISPANGSWSVSGAINFTFNASTEDDIAGCRAWHNYTSWDINNTNSTAVVNSTIHGIVANFTSDFHVEWNVQCNDSRRMTNFSSANFTVFIDSLPPVAAIQYPRNESFNSSSTVQFGFAVSEYNLADCGFYTNATGSWLLNYSAPASKLQEGGFNFTLGMHDGSFMVNVSCSDLAGLSSSNASYWTVSIDTVSPLISLLTPSNNSYMNPENESFQYTVNDNNEVACTLFLDNLTNLTHYNASTGTVNKFYVNLSFGHHNYSINCTDSAGNINISGLYNISVLYITNLSVVESKDPVEILEHFNITSVFNVSANYTTGTGDPIENATCMLYGEHMMDVHNYDHSQEAAPPVHFNNIYGDKMLMQNLTGIEANLSEYHILVKYHRARSSSDNFYIYLRCDGITTIDSNYLVGNITRADSPAGHNVTFKNISVSPSNITSENCLVFFTSPGSNSTDNYHILITNTSSGTSSYSNNSGVDWEVYAGGEAEVRLAFMESNDSLAYDEATQTYIMVDNHYMESGLKFYNVTCNRTNYMTRTFLGNITVDDNVAPLVQINQISPNPASFRVDSVAIEWVAQDFTLRVKKINITYPNGSLLAESTVSPLVLGPENLTVPGNYSIFAWANDSSGFSSSDAANLSVWDLIAPNVTLKSPPNGSVRSSAPVNFDFIAVENFDTQVNCTLYANFTGSFTSVSTLSGALNNTLSTIAYSPGNGIFSWNVECADNATNVNSSAFNYTLTLDSARPAVVLNSPADGYNSTSSLVEFNWTGFDNLDGNLSCNVTINSVINSSDIESLNGSATSFGIGGFNDGFYSWNVSCIDNANNSNISSTRNFGVDTVIPLIGNESVNATLFNVTKYICINLTASDNFGIANVKVTVNFPLSGLVNITLQNRSQDCGNAGGRTWSNRTRLSEEGNYNWTLTYVRDNFGNVNTSYPSSVLNWTAVANTFLNASMASPSANIRINESTSVANSSYSQVCNVSCRADSVDDCQNVVLNTQLNNGSWVSITNTTTTFTSNVDSRFCGQLAIGGFCNQTFNITIGTYAGGSNYSIRCRATSTNAPNHFSDEFNVSVNDFPVAALSSPSGGARLNGVKVLNASSSTDDRTIVKYVFELDNVSDFASPSIICDSADSNCTLNTFSQSQCFNESDCFLRVNTTDNEGLWNSTYISIQVDNVLPRVKLDFPANNAWNSSSLMEFDFTGYDSNIAQCTLFHNGSGWAPNETQDVISGVQAQISVSLPDGSYLWNVRCNDTAGNSAFNSTNYTINVDATFPMADYGILTSDNNSYHSRNWIFANVTSYENNLANITFYLVNGSGLVNATARFTLNSSINFTGLADGQYLYNASVADLAGNANTTAARTITLDTLNPSLDYSISTESNSTHFNSNRNWIFINVTGNDTNEANITFMLVNTTDVVNITVMQSGNRSVNFTNINSNATYIYNVTLEDRANNRNTTASRTITLDNRLPSLEYSAVGIESNNTYFNRNFIFMNVTGNDTNEDTITFMIVNSTDVINITVMRASGNRSINFTNLNANVTYLYNVTLADFAGNTNTTRTRTITLDTSPPSVSLNEPITNTKTRTNNLQFNYTPSDTNIQNCTLFGNFTGTYKSNVTDNAPVNGAKNSLSPGPISDGYYSWSVQCEDRGGNALFASSNFSIMIDATPPGPFTLHLPENGTESQNRTPRLNWTIPYEMSFTNYTVLIDNDPDFSSIDFTYVNYNTPENNTINMTGILADNSRYFWKVIAWDNANNSNESNSSFDYSTDSTLPSIYLIEPANLSTFNESTIDFLYSVNDSNTVANCTLYVNSTQIASDIFPVKNASESMTGTVGGGSRGWYVECSDRAGNTNQSELYVVSVTVEPAHEGGIQFSNLEAVDVAMCPLTNTSFALAWVESGSDPSDNIRVAVYNTDGSVNKSSRIAYHAANNLSRVDCATINETQFVLAWYAQALNDINISMYDSQLNRLQGPTLVDDIAGSVADIGAIGVSDSTVGIAWADNNDNDFNYVELTWTTWALGPEVTVDNNMNPADSLSDLLDLAAVSGNRVASLWYDDFTNDIATSLFASDGTEIIAQTQIGVVSETSRVSAAGLRGDRVAYAYFNSTSYALSLRIDDFSGDAMSSVLGPAVIDTNISETRTVVTGHGVSAAEIFEGQTSMVAVAWFDGGENVVRAAVYDSSGNAVTAPFTVSSAPDNSYKMVSVMSGNSNRNTSICNGTFIVAFSNSSNVAEFRRYRTDGSDWNGRCTPQVGPNITLASPLNSSWSASRAVNFTFNASTEDDIAGCRVWHNATGWGINNTNSTAVINSTIHGIAANYTADYHVIWNVQCNDSRRMQNFSANNFTVLIDATPPIVNLTAFFNNSYVQSGDSLLFNFTLIENANDTCQLWGNFSGVWQLNSSLGRNLSVRDAENDPLVTGFAPRISLGPGEYIWNVWCNDSASNSAFNATNFTLKIDTIDPIVGIFKPLNNTFNQSRSINITFNYTEENLDSCELWTNSSGSWALDHTVNFSQIQNDGQNMTFNGFEGHFRINITCNDSAARYSRNASFFTIMIDPSPPLINFINMTGNQDNKSNWTAQSNIRFYVNATENNTDSCTAYINTTAGWARNTTFSFISDALSASSPQMFADGSYLFNVTCNDSAANTDFTYGTSIVFNVDTAAPLVSVYSPLNSTFNASSSVLLKFNYAENNLENCSLYTNATGSWLLNYSASASDLASSGYNFSLVSMHDGSFRVNITCSDKAGNYSRNSSFYTISIDSNPPFVNQNNQSGYFITGNWSSNGNITFFANVTDNNPQTCVVFSNVTGIWAANATFSYSSNALSASSPQIFADGSYLWNITCNDSASSSGQGAAAVFNVDTVSPLAGIFKPLNNTFNTSRSINITYNFTEINLDSCSLWTNASGVWQADHSASPAEISSGHGTNFTFNGFDGHFMVNVTCNDSSARYSANASYYRLIIDTISPLINFINVTGNQDNKSNWTSQSNIRFYVNATENNTDSCTAYINTSGWASNATFSYISDSLSASSPQMFPDGSYLFNVTCNDSAARDDFTYGASIVFNIDTVAPSVAVRSPANNSYNSTNNIFIAFGVTENNLENCSLYTNATGSFVINYSAPADKLGESGFNFSLLGMHDSNYLINVTCYDHGNYSRNASYWSVIIDSIPPFINFINATGYPNNNFSSQSDIRFYVNATDNNTDSCRIFTNASGAWSANASFSYLSDALSASSTQMFADGSYLWNVTCNDSAANTNFSYRARVLNVDTISPLAAIGSPLNGSHNGSGTVTFRFNVTENNLKNCSLYTNATGSFAVNYSAPFTKLQEDGYNFSLLSMHNGTYAVNITCLDNAANYSRNASGWTVTLDTAPPVIVFINATGYSNSNWSSQSNVQFAAIANDASPENCTVFTNATGNWARNATFGYSALDLNVSPFQMFADGSYLWNITCNDTLGFFNESYGTSFALYVDTIPPVVAMQGLNNSFNASSSVSFRFSVSEPNLANCSLYSNATGTFAANYSAPADKLEEGGYNFSLLGMHDASYLVNVTCYDRAGNYSRNASFWTVTVDTAPPSILLHSPIDSFNTSNSTITFNWTANDNNDANISCDIIINSDVNVSDVGSDASVPANYALPGVGPGFNYWNVTCRDNANNTNTSMMWSFVVVKGPSIMNLSFSPNNQSVLINWSNVTYADYYDIYISINHSHFSEAPNITGIRDANWTDTSANSSIRRYYRISSVRSKANATSSAGAKDMIELAPGWNLVSIPVSMDTLILKNSTNSGFDPLARPWGCLSEIWRYNSTLPNVWEETLYNNGDWTPAVGSENFTSLEPGRGYWFFNNLSRCNISMLGLVPDYNTTVSLVQDFNLIGWYSQDRARLPTDCEAPYPFNVSPSNIISILFYYNETESVFKGTMHFTSADCGGDESWGWFPDSRSSEFTRIQPRMGYYAVSDISGNWIMESR